MLFLFSYSCNFNLISSLGRQTVLFGATVSAESVGVSGIKSTALFINASEQLTNEGCLQVFHFYPLHLCSLLSLLLLLLYLLCLWICSCYI
jgi:hypothetical protein